ncbi:hypothetical protein DTO271G3_7362 [Paecilomyces variotii]|nr:hypothetical protein DTO271G3_7362 [Paecilomyces variotii]
MPLISRVVSIFLRIGEICFGAIVAGIIGWYLHHYDSTHSWPRARWIYTEVVAGLSVLLGLLWLIPFASSFFVWPIDVILGLAWFAAFGVLVDALQDSSCWYGPWEAISWDGRTYLSYNSSCARWKAAEAFSFLSAVFWLASGLVGMWFVFRVRSTQVDAVPVRRRWYSRHYV